MAQPASPVTDEPLSLRDSVSKQRLFAILGSVMLGMLLASLDQTIVGTAMPRVIAELGGLNHYAWVFTAYMLASTVSVPIYGKLSDLYGRRPFFITSMVLFLLGSALSGMAQDMTQLIIFRGVQGLGAGGMMPIAIAIIGDIFPPAERGKWQGLLMSVFGLSTIVGPTLGGWLTDNWGWRWTFYVNIPVGIAAIAAAALTLPKQSRHRQHAIDYLGAALLTLGTVPLLLGFSWAGTDYAWTSPMIIGLFVGAVVLLVAFFFYELRAAEPIISPRLFKNSIFAVSVAAMFLTSIAMYGAIMYLPLFVQAVIGTSATGSGAVLTPLMLGFIVSSIIGGQIMSRTGRYKFLALIGFVGGAFGMYLLSQMDTSATNGLVVRNMVVTGLGLGVMMSLFTIVVQNAFPFKQMGEVTSSLQFFRSIGGTIGVAILGSVMSSSFASNLNGTMPAELAATMSPAQLEALKDPQALLSPEAMEKIQAMFTQFGEQGQALFKQLMGAIKLSLAASITELFMVGAVTMVLGFVVTLFLREIPLRQSNTSAAAAALGEGLAELTAEEDQELSAMHGQPAMSDKPA